VLEKQHQRNQIKAQFAGLDYKFYIMDPLNMLCVAVNKPTQFGLSIKADEA
jgi:hypothetical protein